MTDIAYCYGGPGYSLSKGGNGNLAKLTEWSQRMTFPPARVGWGDMFKTVVLSILWEILKRKYIPSDTINKLVKALLYLV